MMNGFELLKQCALLVHPDLSATDKAVLCVLAAHYNAENGCSFPSIMTIQRESGCGCKQTVIRSISRLKDAELISVKKGFAKNARYFFSGAISSTSSTSVENSTSVKSSTSTKSSTHSSSTFSTHSSSTFRTGTNKKNKKEEQITPSSDDEGVSPAPPFSLSGEDSPQRKPGIPDCPYRKVAELYNSKLGTTLPAIRFITDARKPKMRRLWEFVYKQCQCANEAEGLTAMGFFFDRVTQSSFIMGRSNSNGSHPHWKADFDFLLREDVRTRLLEGSYD